MKAEKIAQIRDWVEPAHPMVVKFHDTLVAIYTRIRDKYQGRIDEAFDSVSKDIGFVVGTTLPIILTLGAKGKVERIALGAEHLKGTLFDKGFKSCLESLVADDPIPLGKPGEYRLPLIWHSALKIRLRLDWMEPAHFPGRLGRHCKRWKLVPQGTDWLEPAHRPWQLRCVEWEFDWPPWDWLEPAHVPPEVMEPAHWFDPGLEVAWQERIVVAVIDEVYPDLRLAGLIASTKAHVRRWADPEVMEPAHFRQRELPAEVRAEIEAVLKRHGY